MSYLLWPYLEFRELLGLATVTSSKNILSCEKSKDMSFPRNILATKSPPGLRTWVVMLRAANRSWAWMYSSMSWRPVTSGAPSHTTISADRQVWPLAEIFSPLFCLLFVKKHTCASVFPVTYYLGPLKSFLNNQSILHLASHKALGLAR